MKDSLTTTTAESAQATAKRLIALDIDGTLLGPDGKIPTGTVDALDLVRAAGHEVVLATGRSVVGLMPAATRLGLVEGFAVCSNGTVTIRLDPTASAGYVIEDARRFDPGPQIAAAVHTAPGSAVVLRVWHGRRVGLTRCEVWSLRDGTWVRHAPVPAGTGATMRGVENAVRDAGLVYPRGEDGRRRAHWRASFADGGPAGFELPLMR